MGSTTDKIKGYANEAMGNAKQAVGKAVGSETLQAEGFAQERKGEAQQMVGKGKEAVSNAVENAKDGVTSSLLSDKVSGYANDAMGNIKQTIGRATGDAELEAEGLAQEAKGEVQKGVAAMKKAVGR